MVLLLAESQFSCSMNHHYYYYWIITLILIELWFGADHLLDRNTDTLKGIG